MLSLCGVGKKKAAIEVARAGNISRFEVPGGRCIELLFVNCYKYVGTKTPFDAHMG